LKRFIVNAILSPIWVNATGALPSTRKAVDFLHGIAADGLDPKDYPTPTLADRDPTRLASDELTLTNSIAAFVRHASTGRISFSRVSGSIYFDLKPPDLQQVLDNIASSHDVAATLDYHSSRSTKSSRPPLPARENYQTRTKPKHSVLAKMEASGLTSLQRKLMSSSRIWSAGVGFREIWVLPT
jgi:murein L,D-transpeptidase YcbB/YkuD